MLRAYPKLLCHKILSIRLSEKLQNSQYFYWLGDGGGGGGAKSPHQKICIGLITDMLEDN